MSIEAQQTADSAASSHSSGAISEFSSLMALASPASAASGTPPALGQPAQQAPSPTAADALRAGVDVQSGPPAKTTAAQEIALRITRPESTSVDVHLIERAGQVHVAVRTPDPGLQTSLRQDLGTLVNSLERAGYRTEAALPHGGLPAQSPAQKASHADSQDKRESNGGWSGSGQPGRDSSGQRRQDQNQRGSQDWTEAMEETK